MPRRVIADGNSCLECRRRKIKCDRSYPCSYCVKKRIECAYPPLRATPNTNLESDTLARVEKIEQRFASLEEGLSEIKQLLQSWSPVVTSQSGRNDNHQEREFRNNEIENNTARSDNLSHVDRMSSNVTWSFHLWKSHAKVALGCCYILKEPIGATIHRRASQQSSE
jgi:Fungal Zn(2)-Cys(6) binuclear cluster domain